MTSEPLSSTVRMFDCSMRRQILTQFINGQFYVKLLNHFNFNFGSGNFNDHLTLHHKYVCKTGKSFMN